ncbi:MAG: phosphoglycerate kinase [Promethearchaeota archaeon]
MELKYKSMDEVDLSGKRVLLRVDVNSTIDVEKNEIREDPRIKAIVPTVEALAGSKLVILAHQSRPGKKDFTSLELHAKRLDSYVKQKVKFVDDIFGDKAINAIKSLEVGEVLVLDNVRKWAPENEKMTPEAAAETELVKTLAPLFDYFVNDAFGAAHRAQPSIIGWPTLLAGPLLVKEINALKKIFESKDKMVMLVGGAKAETKYKAIKYNVESGKAEKALVAGLTAVLIYEAIGKTLGDVNRKIIEKELGKLGDDIKEFMDKHGDKISLPVDFAYEKDGKREEVPMEDVAKIGVTTGDIGQKTIDMFKKDIVPAKIVCANGPPGIFEKEIFQKGTYDLIDAMVENQGYSIIGGGEMGVAAEETGKADKINFISTGGGAMLEFLSGKKLPLLEALARSAEKF